MAGWIKMPLRMEVGLRPGDFVLDGDPTQPSPKRRQTPNFRRMSIVAKRLGGPRWHLIGMEVGLRPGHIVLDGDPAPLPKKATEPHFSAHVYCGQTAGWAKIPTGTEIGLGPGHIVLDGDPAPPPKRGKAPQFSAHVYCGQTAGWIKMALDIEVGVGPGHIVLDGDTAPLPTKRGHSPQIFGPCLLWPNG